MITLPSDFNVQLVGNHLAQIHGDLVWCHSTRKEEVHGNRHLDSVPQQALMHRHLFAVRVSSCAILSDLSQLFFQLHHLISLIARPFTSLLLLNKHYALSFGFYRNHTWLSKKPWSANTPAEEGNCADVKLEISSRSMSIKPVGSGISWCNRGISRSQTISLHQHPR